MVQSVATTISKIETAINERNFDVAERLCDDLLLKQPKHHRALFLRGVAYAGRGKHLSAIESLSRSLVLSPDHVQGLYQRAISSRIIGDFPGSQRDLEHILTLSPEHFDALKALGQIYTETGKFEQAKAILEKATRINPGHHAPYEWLAHLHDKFSEPEKAYDYFQKALERAPENINLINNIAAFLYNHNNAAMALKYIKKILEGNPNHLPSHNNLGSVLCDLREVKASCASYENALRIDPYYKDSHSNLLLTLHYDTIYSAEEIYLKHISFGKRHTRKQYSHEAKLFAESPLTKLRIGYLSSDFRKHSVAFFIYPIILHHNTEEFEIFCYSNVQKHDEFTEKFIHIDKLNWRDITNSSDDKIAEIIHRDKLDVIVDLAGHTASNCLTVLAYKPAPIQITYLGYPNTTGLPAIDYRITDKWADPTGSSEYLHTEQLIRLTQGFISFEPPQVSFEPEPLPCNRSGSITFGSFNKINKLTSSVIHAWAEILKKVPHSRLLIKSKNLVGLIKDNLLKEFAGHGIGPERIITKNWTKSIEEHLQLYNNIDIALDSFPYNGTTTTLEALWMGRPVLTLTGYTHVTRVGNSILSRLGLDELISYSPQDYIDTAVTLANNRSVLSTLSGQLREKLFSSGILNTKQFTLDLEATYRKLHTHRFRQNAFASKYPESIEILNKYGTTLSMPGDLADKATYMALETERLSDAEEFFLRVAAECTTVIETDAGYGQWSLSVAYIKGDQVRVYCTEDNPKKRDFLRYNQQANFLDNCTILQLTETANKSKNEYTDQELNNCLIRRIAAVLTPHSPQQPILLKVNSAAWSVDSIIAIEELLQTSNVLLVLRVEEQNRQSLEQIVATLRENNHEISLFIRGLDRLYPFLESHAQECDYLAVYSTTMAEWLQKENFLDPGFAAETSEFPNLQSVIEVINSRFSYAQTFSQGWLANIADSSNETYNKGISLLLGAKLKSDSIAAGRHLFQSVQLLYEAWQSTQSSVHILTLARATYEAGLLAVTRDLLNTLIANLQEKPIIDELKTIPFFHVCPRFDSVNCGTHPNEWLLAGLLEQLEILAYESSYYGDENALIRLETIDSTGFGCVEMERRWQLLRMRHGLQKRPIASLRLARPAPDNRNVRYWAAYHP